jgi:hypothetical protein
MDIDEVRAIFDEELTKIRTFEKGCKNGEVDLTENRKQVEISVAQIVETIG